MWPVEEFGGRIEMEEEVFIDAMGQLEVITEELLLDDGPIDFSRLRWRELGLIGRGIGISGDIWLGILDWEGTFIAPHGARSAKASSKILVDAFLDLW